MIVQAMGCTDCSESYRPKEYVTEGQPWDPVSAVTCSLVGDISNIAMGIADFPRELFKSRPKSKREDSSTTAGKDGSTSKESLPLSKASTQNLAASAGESVRSTSPSGNRSLAERPVTSPTDPSKDTPAAEPTGTTSGESSRTPVETPTSPQGRPQSPLSSVFSDPPTITTETDVTRPDSLLSPRETRSTSPAPSQDRLTPKPDDKARPQRSPSPAARSMEGQFERAMAAGDSVERVVSTGVKSPMNFCLGLAKGFRNMPRLYNDDTVRPVEKVTDLPSGIKVAGKEFALGFYDGISGLATQPLRGAEKEGAVGLVKGFGKGIGGLVLKPAAGESPLIEQESEEADMIQAVWSIPAYTMQGMHASIRNVFASSVENYIIASRILQGEDDIEYSTHEEQDDVLARWKRVQFELRKWHALRLKEEKEKGRGASPVLGSPGNDNQDQFAPPKTGFFNTLGMSFDERKALHARKAAWKKAHVETRVPTDVASRTGSASRTETSSTYSAEEDAEFERAIQASVRETSNGNPDDDARIEDAIRASVNQVRSMGQGLPGAKAETHEDEDLSITDEEYQQLIEKAIHQSMSAQDLREDPLGSDDEDLKRVLEESKNPIVRGYGSDDDEDLKRVLEESKQPESAGQTGDDDEELRRAIEESMTAHKDEESKLQAAKTEEDIVLEYVKKQSLAEEEYRKQVAKGKGKATEGTHGDDDDEELKRVMEESLRLSGRSGEGSGAGSSRA